jgi:DNA polymerase-3 subunit epsilon
MKVLVWDTETNGLPKWELPSLDPSQPHLCQFVSLLFDDQTGDELEYYSELVKPDGWRIPPELTAIHRITEEQAVADGVPEIDVARHFYKAAVQADRIVGFSVDFDIRIMRIAMKRAAIPEDALEKFSAMVKAKKHDVMRQCTRICNLPPSPKMMATGRKTPKSPTLKEAVKIILKEDLGDAHDARADVLATKRLYEHLNPVIA